MAEENKRSEAEVLKPVWFAALMAALITCLQQFLFYTQWQWRVGVFLALNIILLAILFTSTMETQIQSDDQQIESTSKNVGEYEEDERSKKCSDDYVPKSEGPCVKIAVEDEDDEDGKEGSFELSKEELNERVEAFIKMFRQQYLVSDAKSASCRLRSFSSTTDDDRLAKHLLVNSV